MAIIIPQKEAKADEAATRYIQNHWEGVGEGGCRLGTGQSNNEQLYLKIWCL